MARRTRALLRASGDAEVATAEKTFVFGHHSSHSSSTSPRLPSRIAGTFSPFSVRFGKRSSMYINKSDGIGQPKECDQTHAPTSEPDRAGIPEIY